jgi:enamine deaminase RidA (YjgF/YER057c/UK114 family)
MGKTHINPAHVAAPVGTYSHVVTVPVGGGRLLFLAGQVPLDEKGNLVGAGDVERQSEQVFENIGRILASLAASAANLVKITVFVTDASRRAEVVRARSRFLVDPPPASTFVEVRRLADPSWLVEVEAIAYLPD